MSGTFKRQFSATAGKKISLKPLNTTAAVGNTSGRGVYKKTINWVPYESQGGKGCGDYSFQPS